MNQNYGSKRLVVGAHYGMRDWLSQRVTAALMAWTFVYAARVRKAGELLAAAHAAESADG